CVLPITSMTSSLITHHFNLMLFKIMMDDHRSTFYIILTILVHLSSMQTRLIQRFIVKVRDVFPRFDPAFFTIKSNFPSFIRRIGGQRIIHNRIVRVFYLRRHLVIDIDLRTIHAVVSYVSVMFFIVRIQLHISATLRDIPIVVTLLLVGTTTAAFTEKWTIVSIVLQITIGKNLFRIRIQPPIQQIKMMRRFMNPQCPAILPLTMPSSEIRGTMINVQIPAEIHTRDLADRVFMQKFLDLCDIRTPTIIKTYYQFSIGSTFGI